MSSPRIVELTWLPARAAPLSVGITTDADWIAWGDIRPQPVSVIPDSVTEALTQALSSQPAGDLKRHTTTVRKLLSEADSLWLSGPLQQALLSAAARARGQSRAQVLREEYGSENGRLSSMGFIPIFFEVDNDVATAEIVKDMIALAPEGLGFRLVAGKATAAFGYEAEFLQRFTRELAGRVSASGSDEAPSKTQLYLGLRGGLGDLVEDPRRNIGAMLGFISGLEQAALPYALWLEDAVELEDVAQSAALLHQLKDFVRLRKMESRLVASVAVDNFDDLSLLLHSDAIHAVCLDVTSASRPESLFRVASQCREAGVEVFLRAVPPAGGRAAQWLAAVAIAVEAQGLLVSIEGGRPEVALALRSAVLEEAADRRAFLQTVN